MKSAEILEMAHNNLVGVYRCLPLSFDHGEGSYLYDPEGNRYLDFFCGIAVTSLGHNHPGVIRAITEQARRLTHVSNVFHTESMARLAERLGSRFGDGKIFFANSGAEANEAAIKLARRWGHKERGGRFEILTALGSFHGRTFATISATGQEQYHQGFQPLLPGFRFVPFDDLGAIERAAGDNTVAVMLEPIQGEGGVVVPHDDYLGGVREFCDRRKMLLILDEVQVGVGRTGKFFAYEHSGIKPDIVTLAKALGGGLPIGAMIAESSVAESFTPGSHGSTFGGNPVACAAALAVIDALDLQGVLENAATIGNYLIERLREITQGVPEVLEVRGRGMIIGVAMKGEAAPVVAACLKERLLVNAAARRVLRLLPPLNLSRAEADAGLEIIERAFNAADGS